MEIKLEFSKQNLRKLLQELIHETATYNHQDFSNWISRFVYHFIKLFDNKKEIDANLEEIVNDIDAQWELYLANTYSVEELQNIHLLMVKFPIEWLKNWDAELE